MLMENSFLRCAITAGSQANTRKPYTKDSADGRFLDSLSDAGTLFSFTGETPMNESVRKHKGREFVTVSEFASRIGCTRITIYNRIKAGDLQGIHINKSKELWLDWETQRKQWLLTKKTNGRKIARKDDNHSSNPAQKRKRGRPKKIQPEIISVQSIKTKSAVLPSAPTLNRNEDNATKGEDLIDLSRINPEDHKDCWIMDGTSPIYNPLTDEPMLDYEKLKLKLVAQKYQLDLDEKRGQLIEKEELARSMTAISHIMMAALRSIPQRYESILTSMAERMTGYVFSVNEKSLIREALKNEAQTIAKSISIEIEKLEENE